ncbi:MAG TPA: hypothetical protein PLZ25_08015 [Flavobacteriales bacterium]|nr:hypothetical protein [Flavobacteriales bacterium]
MPVILAAQATFPPLEGETVQGNSVQLPTNGSWSIMAVVAGKKAQPALEEWFARRTTGL